MVELLGVGLRKLN